MMNSSKSSTGSTSNKAYKQKRARAEALVAYHATLVLCGCPAGALRKYPGETIEAKEARAQATDAYAARYREVYRSLKGVKACGKS